MESPRWISKTGRGPRQGAEGPLPRAWLIGDNLFSETSRLELQSKTPGVCYLMKEVLTHNILRERRERLAALAAETIDLAKVSYKTLNLKLTMFN